jgi:phage tail sheath protein FI
MPIKDYRFVSPGVQVKEIDQSVLEPTTPEIGPVIVGKFLKGPTFTPTVINTINDFRDVFGGVITGDEKVGDVWREGNTKLTPSYSSIAAEAYLDAAVTPITVIRLLGEQFGGEGGVDTDAGEAGWKVGNPNAAAANNAGVYALVLNKLTGTTDTTIGGFSPNSHVAAMFYVANGGNIILSGKQLSGSSNTSGSGVWVKAGTDKKFTALVYGSAGILTETIEFNLDTTSDKYIRNVFNTNPTVTNSFVVSSDTRKTYWLGETFEKFIDEKIGTVANTERLAAALVPLTAIDGVNPKNFQFSAQHSKTGWIFSQHQGSRTVFGASEDQYLSSSSNVIETQVKKLFKFVSLGKGEFEQENYKIIIENIKGPTNSKVTKFGTFDVKIVPINSKDKGQQTVEVFAGVNLDKNSANYIAARIGDKYLEWDYNEERLLQKGDFDNLSSIVRVEMSEEIKNGIYGENLLPFGFFGPPRPKKIQINPSGSMLDGTYLHSGSYFGRAASGGANDNGTIVFNYTGSGDLTSSIVFPSLPLVLTASRISNDGSANYFGVNKATLANTEQNKYFHNDLVKTLGKSGFYEPSGSNFEYSFVFTLDDVIVPSTSSITASWSYGSRRSGTSYTALSGNGVLPTGSNEIKGGLQVNRFALTLHGGFDGLNVTETEPLRNSLMTVGSSTARNSYVYNTYDVAMKSIKDPDFINMNLLAVPGLTHPDLTEQMINICQERGDAMAVIDLTGDYQPKHESATRAEVKPTEVRTVVSNLSAREINSSYGAAYFPWVEMSVTKPNAANPSKVWVPPSVVALGTYASSQAKSQLWFAPAGFNRGGLKSQDAARNNKYTAGFAVTNVALELNSKQRDDLYEVNINPIASFVNEGIVVFGQKTLQVTPSALDRINVRRLLIYVKKRISLIASGILFDPNVDVTWARFTSQANDFLSGVKAGLGLAEYRVDLDKTTTTDDLIDRNILYAKVYLKPTRAIEFIAVDFIITKTGASFND